MIGESPTLEEQVVWLKDDVASLRRAIEGGQETMRREWSDEIKATEDRIKATFDDYGNALERVAIGSHERAYNLRWIGVLLLVVGLLGQTTANVWSLWL